LYRFLPQKRNRVSLVISRLTLVVKKRNPVSVSLVSVPRGDRSFIYQKGDRSPPQKKPGFSENFGGMTDIFYRNPVSASKTLRH
jgi:hypothetical protein